MRAAETAQKAKEAKEAEDKKAAGDRHRASAGPGRAYRGLGRPFDGQLPRRGQTARGEDHAEERIVRVQDDGHTSSRSVHLRDGVFRLWSEGPRLSGADDRDIRADADPARALEVAGQSDTVSS